MEGAGLVGEGERAEAVARSEGDLVVAASLLLTRLASSILYHGITILLNIISCFSFSCINIYIT